MKFDCSGLVCQVYKDAGIAIPRTSSEMGNKGRKITKETAAPGDIIIFDLSGKGKTVNHVAIILDSTTMIHSVGPGGVDIVRQSDWANYIMGYRTFVKKE